MKSFDTFKKRQEFLKMQRSGHSLNGPFFVLQVETTAAPSTTWKYGITASKKVGNAVQRNFAKRRLRALYREVVIDTFYKNHKKELTFNVVLIAKKSILKANYAHLKENLNQRLQTYFSDL